MEIVFELLFQFFGEALLQAGFELLVEFGLQKRSGIWKRQNSVLLSVLGFIFWGAVCGGLSLLIFPESAISNPDLRIANLLLTPILLGALMAVIGRARRHRGQTLVRLDQFGFAFTFAFSMALVRFVWAA